MKRLMFTSFFTLCMIGVFAQQGEVFSTTAGAISGYDAVAYFKENKPVKGKKEFAYTWRDAAWYFSSKENRDAFIADPEKFAPQYGGYCAYGTAEGHKAPTQSDAWTIVNDKLYFNYNKDVKKLWMKDQPGFIRKADENWPVVKGGE